MTLEEYQKLLQHHDWYYYFSDDHRVWLHGEAEIIELAKTGPDDFKRVYNEEHAKYHDRVVPFPEVVNS